jgi:hypothetical protein
LNLGKPEVRRCGRLQRAKENQRKNEALAKADEEYLHSGFLSIDTFLARGA